MPGDTGDPPRAGMARSARRETPIRGTAWPSPNTMIEARDAAGVPHDPREITDVTAQPHSEAAGTLQANLDASRRALRIIGATTQVLDSQHGLIEAPVARFIAALSYDQHDLRALLIAHDAAAGITGAEPATTLAALVARYDAISLDQPPETILEQPHPSYHPEPDLDISP